jgi:hypothetical protein
MFRKPDANKGKDPLADRMKAISKQASFAAVEIQPQHTYSAIGSKKRATRRAMFRQASIVAVGERIEVVVKNVSETGARIDFFRRLDLPSRVLLQAPSLQLKRWARVVWQTDSSAGLHFED